MQEENKKQHRHIDSFNPDVTSLEKAYQDYFVELKKFTAGEEYLNFNEFISEDAIEYQETGDGVSYIVWNVFYDEQDRELFREIVAYYTLAATSIPYEDRIRLDDLEAEELGKEFDIEICGISALEIKMFAVDEKYQNIFYEYAEEDLPISAWVMKSIIQHANEMSGAILGFKAILLHSVPEARSFYEKNGFNLVTVNMKPLHCLDSEFEYMYLALREIHMNYDK